MAGGLPRFAQRTNLQAVAVDGFGAEACAFREDEFARAARIDICQRALIQQIPIVEVFGLPTLLNELLMPYQPEGIRLKDDGNDG